MQYFKDKIGSTSLSFLQETQSDSKVEQKWKEDFKGPVVVVVVFFCFCFCVLIAYFGTGTFTFKKQQTNKESCILILDVSISDFEYILINLYNANIENEQIDVLSSMFELGGNKAKGRISKRVFEKNLFQKKKPKLEVKDFGNLIVL